MKTYSNYH